MIIASNAIIREAPLSHVFLPISMKAEKTATNISMIADNIVLVDFIFPPHFGLLHWLAICKH